MYTATALVLAVAISMVLFEGLTPDCEGSKKVAEEHAATAAAADQLFVAGTLLSMFPATVCC